MWNVVVLVGGDLKKVNIVPVTLPEALGLIEVIDRRVSFLLLPIDELDDTRQIADISGLSSSFLDRAD